MAPCCWRCATFQTCCTCRSSTSGPLARSWPRSWSATSCRTRCCAAASGCCCASASPRCVFAPRSDRRRAAPRALCRRCVPPLQPVALRSSSVCFCLAALVRVHMRAGCCSGSSVAPLAHAHTPRRRRRLDPHPLPTRSQTTRTTQSKPDAAHARGDGAVQEPLRRRAQGAARRGPHGRRQRAALRSSHRVLHDRARAAPQVQLLPVQQRARRPREGRGEHAR